MVAQDPAIGKVTNALHDTYKVDYIAPGHCSGEPTFTALQKVFGDRYLYAGLGTTLSVGANPRPASNQGACADQGRRQPERRSVEAREPVISSHAPATQLITVVVPLPKNPNRTRQPVTADER